MAAIGKRAGVSKADFYKHFASKDECFLVAFDVAVERIRERVAAACAEREGWATGVRDALAALLELLAGEPALARLALVEGLRGGQGIYDRYQEALQSFVSLFSEGAPPAPGGAAMPEATDEAVVGGIATLLGRRILAGEQDLEPLRKDLTEFALTPYLGPVEARRIAGANGRTARADART